MYQGFYNLTSGMLTQTRNLNVIGNNMVNIQTAGYKRDKMVSSTFQEEMMYRTGKHYKDNAKALATTSKIRTAQQTYVNYEQGAYDQTEGIYDFALGDSGFFCVETPMGVQYTRNGSFHVDDEGYLTLNGMGRVLGTDGPIQIDNEDFTVDKTGRISVLEVEGGGEDGEAQATVRELGKLRVVDFADYAQLTKITGDVFRTAAAPQAAADPQVRQRMVESSNVSMAEEMTQMISGQRSLQSAAQILKIYDQLEGKLVVLGSVT